MGLNDTFGFYQYTSDDTTPYVVKLSTIIATAGGFTVQLSPLGNKVWPFHSKNMRHVLLVDGSGNRTKLPCATNTYGAYTSGGTAQIGSRTYTVEGAIGEKRKLNSIS
jgi:hypothetical protein